MNRRTALPLLVLPALLWFFPRPAPAAVEAPPTPRTVILVRHAEKATDDPRDPSLSEAGQARAAALARLLARSRPGHLVASEFRRTQATLAPLAAALGLTVETLPAAQPAALGTALAAAEPGSTWVVAGHSNTLPALAQALGVTLPDLKTTAQGPQLGDDEYDRLFVLTLPAAASGCAPAVLELRYGN